MKKILMSLLAVGTMAAVAATGTYAWFTDSATSSNNSFESGTLLISMDQSMMASINPVISDWAPGEEATVRFDVKNDGTLPVNLKGKALGAWTASGLDATKVKATRVEAFVGGSWTTLIYNGGGLTGEYYYSPNGTNTALYELAPGATENFRLTVMFDSSADNSYQNQTYVATVHMAAKQTSPSTAAWPSTY